MHYVYIFSYFLFHFLRKLSSLIKEKEKIGGDKKEDKALRVFQLPSKDNAILWCKETSIALPLGGLFDCTSNAGCSICSNGIVMPLLESWSRLGPEFAFLWLYFWDKELHIMVLWAGMHIFKNIFSFLTAAEDISCYFLAGMWAQSYTCQLRNMPYSNQWSLLPGKCGQDCSPSHSSGPATQPFLPDKEVSLLLAVGLVGVAGRIANIPGHFVSWHE